MSEAAAILELRDVHTHFPIYNAWGRRAGWLRAVDGLSVSIARGEILGIVGESGCGKTTIGKTIAGIHKPTAGSILFEGQDIGPLSPREGRDTRKRLQYCYQDPGASLDPHWRIGRSLAEPLLIHTDIPRSERRDRVREVLAAVGLPEGHLDLYPHEISGGQQRRVGLARILMVQPSTVVLDEPTSGLDVSVQAIVLNLLVELRASLGMSYLFVSHDLHVVRLLCDRVIVMRAGAIVEQGPTERVMTQPEQAYTRELLAALPHPPS